MLLGAREPELEKPFIDRSCGIGYKRIMNIDRHTPLLCLAVALVSGALLFAAAAASADTHSSDHDLAHQALERGEVLPLRTVLDQAERNYGGQVLKVEFERDDGQFIYKIRVLQSDGRMIKLVIDAKDGHVIKVKRRDKHGND